MIVHGNTVGTTTPRADWNQTNSKRADFIKNKPEIAPSGYGYGVALTSVTGSTEAELEDSLTAVLKGMANYTTRQMKCLGTFIGMSTYVLLTIYKHTTAYALVVFETVSGSTLKKVYSNAWQPLEWENPPLAKGIEYRTTERCNDKPVYRQRIVVTYSNDVGSANGSAGIANSHNVYFSSLVRASVTATSGGLSYTFNVKSAKGATQSTVSDGQLNVEVQNMVLSKPTFVFDIAYVKP